MMREVEEQRKRLEKRKHDIIQMIKNIDNEKFINMVYFYVRSAYNEEQAED